MKDKRGEGTGESVIMIYRILLVSLIAFVVLGESSVLYAYEISVRDSEALIFARQMVDCIAPSGILNLDALDSKDRGDIFSFCGYDKSETKRFFLSIVAEENGKEVSKLVSGDEGLLWVRKIYMGGFKTENIEQYRPGYYGGIFSVRIVKNHIEKDGKIKVEVIVKDES